MPMVNTIVLEIVKIVASPTPMRLSYNSRSSRDQVTSMAIRSVCFELFIMISISMNVVKSFRPLKLERIFRMADTLMYVKD